MPLRQAATAASIGNRGCVDAFSGPNGSSDPAGAASSAEEEPEEACGEDRSCMILV